MKAVLSGLSGFVLKVPREPEPFSKTHTVTVSVTRAGDAPFCSPRYPQPWSWMWELIHLLHTELRSCVLYGLCYYTRVKTNVLNNRKVQFSKLKDIRESQIE